MRGRADLSRRREGHRPMPVRTRASQFEHFRSVQTQSHTFRRHYSKLQVSTCRIRNTTSTHRGTRISKVMIDMIKGKRSATSRIEARGYISLRLRAVGVLTEKAHELIHMRRQAKDHESEARNNAYTHMEPVRCLTPILRAAGNAAW